VKIYGVTGWKNTGKTSLVERLVCEFSARGLTVATVKHAHHSADVDVPGTDSYRHRAAGAGQVILATPARWALMTEVKDGDEPALDDLLTQLAPHDIVLVEGYKGAPHPKIECYRAAAQTRQLISDDNASIRAVATDTSVDATVPVFDLNDVTAIANFIWNDLT